MPRIQAFEFCENPNTPRFIRESLIETLGTTLRSAGIYDPATPLFAEFCRRTKCTTILDLGSGSGEPVSVLVESLERQGVASPRFYLSDRLPNIAAMTRVAERHPKHIRVIKEAVDATDVAPKFKQPARTIISTFHHFPPELARAILADSARQRRALFILEGFPRDLRALTPILAGATLPVLANPLTSDKDQLLKAWFTYVQPVIPVLGIWDAIVSVLRVYTEDELMAMVAPFRKKFSWEYHRIATRLGGTLTVFMGIPERA